MQKSDRIVIIGAGVFGLSTACQLAAEGYNDITVLDRHLPPVPDGSSVDISRIIRFDYGDDIYLQLAYEAYKKWTTPKYKDIFFPSPFIVGSNSESSMGKAYTASCTKALSKQGLPFTHLKDAEAAKHLYTTLTGTLAKPGFVGYTNRQAGWADAQKAITQLRDDCLELGVSFIGGRAGTVIGFDTSSDGKIREARTLQGTKVHGTHFILSAGAWSSSLVPFYNSTISTAQVLGYMQLTDDEMKRLQDLPICINFATGWFNFPPHPDTKMLKIAIHGWGYTRTQDSSEKQILPIDVSSPPLPAVRERRNFAPKDGEARLREGLREILPELADRAFDRLALCWYTDTPTGDFIMDFHPDHENLFIAGGGSGHAFKFLPVLGEYITKGLKRELPQNLSEKWRFRTEHRGDADVFKGDGSRGGPVRRELSSDEVRAKL